MNRSRVPHRPSREEQRATGTIAERVEQILGTRGLSLAKVSRETVLRHGRTPHSFIPHNFYYDLGLRGYSPKMQQIFALSHITNYRLADWLAVFGLDLTAIPRLQIEFPCPRTGLLDSTLYQPGAWITWFADRNHEQPPPRLLPLSRLLIPSAPRRAADLASPGPSPFLYAKIGREAARSAETGIVASSRTRPNPVGRFLPIESEDMRFRSF